MSSYENPNDYAIYKVLCIGFVIWLFVHSCAEGLGWV